MSLDKKQYLYFEGTSAASLTKYLIKQCGGKSGVYKFLYHDKVDDVMKLQTVISEYRTGGDGEKKMYIHQFRPETVIKNGAEVVPTGDIKEKLDSTQSGGSVFPYPSPFSIPISPVRYYETGPVYVPLGPSPFNYLYSLVSFSEKVGEMKVDGIECGTCTGIGTEANKKIVRDKVEEVFKKRYNENDTDINFTKITDVTYTSSKNYTVTIHYTKKSYVNMLRRAKLANPFAVPKRKKIDKAERINEIRKLVNDALKATTTTTTT